MDMWNLTNAVHAITDNVKEQEELILSMKEAIRKEMKHSKVVQENKSSKFLRSTEMSRKISENYRMMNCLTNATISG